MRLGDGQSQVMNLTMAIWMKQHPVFSGIAAAVGSPNQVMVMPSSEFGDFLLADRAASVLFPPEVQQLPPTLEIVGHFDIESLLKVPLPGGIVRINLSSG